ncbi:MAG TPA: hypothetical protein VF911_02135 [Thermoanaerobaculia bacterium]|jgi:hypothetical protein
MLKKLYLLFALIVIGGYAFAGLRGWEPTRQRKAFAPQSIRGARGGSHTFLYGGYRGGK